MARRPASPGKVEHDRTRTPDDALFAQVVGQAHARRAAEVETEAVLRRQILQEEESATRAVRSAAAKVAKALTARQVPPDLSVVLRTTEQVKRFMRSPRFDVHARMLFEGWAFCRSLRELTDPDIDYSVRRSLYLDSYILDAKGNTAQVHTGDIEELGGVALRVVFSRESDWKQCHISGPLDPGDFAYRRRKILQGLAELALDNGIDLRSDD